MPRSLSPDLQELFTGGRVQPNPVLDPNRAILRPAPPPQPTGMERYAEWARNARQIDPLTWPYGVYQAAHAAKQVFDPATRQQMCMERGDPLSPTAQQTAQNAMRYEDWLVGRLGSRLPATFARSARFGVTLGPGESAITEALNRMSNSPRSGGNEWVSVPEGGQGLYLRVNPYGIDVANARFDIRGTGAFTRYLNHIEAEAKRLGLPQVTAENIENPQLIEFYRKRGYETIGTFGGLPTMVKRIR